MENRFRVVAEITRTADAHHNRRPIDDARLAQAAADELFLMGMPRVNVLLAGRNEVIESVLRTLLANVQQPVTAWRPGEPLILPSLEGPGTMILHEVGALGLQEQIQLLGWSGRAMGITQIISTTSTPLLPRVSAGAFIDTLYYRLNTVYVDVSGSDESRWRD